MDLWVAKEDDEEWTPKTPWTNLQGHFYLDENGYDLGSLVYRTYQDLVPIRPLNDQLVPIIDKNDFDKVAKEMLEQFYPEIFDYKDN